MKRRDVKEHDVGFATLMVRRPDKSEFREFADERRRNIADIAAAALKALKLLPREQQDALIEGRELSMSA